VGRGARGLRVADLHLVRAGTQAVGRFGRDVGQVERRVPHLAADRDVGREPVTAGVGTQRHEGRVGGADLVGRYRQPALRQGELDRHRDRRCHAHAFFLVGRPHSRYSEAERIADPADHVARLVPDTVHGLADGLAGVVGGLARAGGRVDDTARVDGHVEPDFAAHPEGRTRRRADLELAVVTHAELRIGGGTDTGPRLTVHTGTDTGDLAADITTGLGTGERLG